MTEIEPQWIPTGSAGVAAGIMEPGSAGNPANKYCNHAAPVGNKISRPKIMSI